MTNYTKMMLNVSICIGEYFIYDNFFYWWNLLLFFRLIWLIWSNTCRLGKITPALWTLSMTPMFQHHKVSQYIISYFVPIILVEQTNFWFRNSIAVAWHEKSGWAFVYSTKSDQSIQRVFHIYFINIFF